MSLLYTNTNNDTFDYIGFISFTLLIKFVFIIVFISAIIMYMYIKLLNMGVNLLQVHGWHRIHDWQQTTSLLAIRVEICLTIFRADSSGYNHNQILPHHSTLPGIRCSYGTHYSGYDLLCVQKVKAKLTRISISTSNPIFFKHPPLSNFYFKSCNNRKDVMNTNFLLRTNQKWTIKHFSRQQSHTCVTSTDSK